MRARDFVPHQRTLTEATPFSHKLFGCGGASLGEQAIQERFDIEGVDLAVAVGSTAVIGTCSRCFAPCEADFVLLDCTKN